LGGTEIGDDGGATDRHESVIDPVSFSGLAGNVEFAVERFEWMDEALSAQAGTSLTAGRRGSGLSLNAT
jgi:hypothetical protein